MAEARIGRVIVASLHQAIADVIPQRLEFYENWLNSHGLREGTIGLAPLLAVISFLRTEGRAYESVVARAGEYAADWSIAAMSPLKRRFYLAFPMWFRARFALSIARGLIRESYSGSTAKMKVRRNVATVELQGSLFCSVRETAPIPLCGFYGSAVERVLKLFQVPAEAKTAKCRASGAPSCDVTIALYGSPPDEQARVA